MLQDVSLTNILWCCIKGCIEIPWFHKASSKPFIEFSSQKVISRKWEIYNFIKYQRTIGKFPCKRKCIQLVKHMKWYVV